MQIRRLVFLQYMKEIRFMLLILTSVQNVKTFMMNLNSLKCVLQMRLNLILVTMKAFRNCCKSRNTYMVSKQIPDLS
jgi:hypothetical protein